MNLELLISFQRQEDPVFIHEDLGKTGEWTCSRLDVVYKDKKEHYRWAKNAKLRALRKTHRPYEIEEIMFHPIDGCSPIILYLTPDREVYNSIIGEAKGGMETNKESVLHNELFFEFISAEVAIQAGFVRDHFVIIVMNRNDFDKGLRLN